MLTKILSGIHYPIPGIQGSLLRKRYRGILYTEKMNGDVPLNRDLAGRLHDACEFIKNIENEDM